MKLFNLSKFPKNVVILSYVSLLNDIAGETIKKLFPLFLANVLGVKTTVIGFIEGVGEATPHLIEPFSGYFSDKRERRKGFVVIGQILRSSMILLLFVTSWPQALLVRFLDRTGKGISDGPRDALVSISSKVGEKGKAFGLGRAMDNLGATIGIIILILILLILGNQFYLSSYLFKTVIIFIVFPSLVIAFLLIVLGVSEKKDANSKFLIKDHLGKEYYTFLAISFLFYLGNFSEGFLVLKAQSAGVSLLGIFFLIGIFSLISSLVALPVASYSDHHQRRRVLAYGWLVLAASYFGFALSKTIWQLLPLFTIYGIYYGSTQGVAKAIVSDLVPPSRQGLAFGIYNMTVGFALLPASTIAGYLWQNYNPSYSFYFGAILSTTAALGLFHILPHPRKIHA